MTKKFSAILKQNTYKSETVNGKTTEKLSSAEYFTKDGVDFRKINDGKVEVRCDKCGTWYDVKKSKCPECGLFNHAAVADVNLKEDTEPIIFSKSNGNDGNSHWGTDYFNNMDIPGYRSNRTDIKNDRGYGRTQYDDARKKLDDEIEAYNNEAYVNIKALYDTDIKRLQLDRLKKLIERYVNNLNNMYNDQDLQSGDVRAIKRAVNIYNGLFNNFQIQMKKYYTRIKDINDKTIQRLLSRLRGSNKSKWLDRFELDGYNPDELNTYYENDIYQWKYMLDMLNEVIKNIGTASTKNTYSIEVNKYDDDAEFRQSETGPILQVSAPPKDMKKATLGKGFIMYENMKLSPIEESIIFGSGLTNISDILDINEAADKPTAGNLNQAVANARKSKAAWISGKGSIIDANRDNNIAKNMEYQYNKKDDKDPVSGQPLKEAEKVSDNTKKNITRALDNQINSAMKARERVEQNKARANDRFAKNTENIDNRIQRLRQHKASVTDENDDDENVITESDENNKPEVIATSSDGKNVYLLDKNKKAETVDPDSLTEEDVDRTSADIRREKHTQSQFNIYNSDFRPDYNDATKNYKYPVNAVAYVKNKYYPILSSGVGGKLFAAMVFGDDIPEEEMGIYNQMKSMDEVKACISEVTIAIKRLIKSGEKNFDSATNNSIMAQKSNFVNIYKQLKDK